MTGADDHDLAQPAVKRCLPAHRVGMEKPALGQRRRVEQHAVNVDHAAAAAGLDPLQEFGELGTVLRVNQGNARHASYSSLKSVAFMIGVQRASSSLTSRCAAAGLESRIGSKPEVTRRCWNSGSRSSAVVNSASF